MFNEKQKQIVNHIEGPLLCIAGPGSGKTTSVIGRVLNMVDKGINPNNILVVTFTKMAADEMRERYSKESGKDGVHFGTIHAICLKILNENLSKQQILSEEEAKDFFAKIIDKRYIERAEIDSCVQNVMTAISCYKNAQEQIEEGMTIPSGLGVTAEELVKYYQWYERWKKENKKIDFDDILIQTLDLLKADEKVLNKCRKQYQYIIIDEYQDTNNLQAAIFYLLAAPLNNICIVGDDDQSIYGFRGANPKVMLDFEKVFPGTMKIVLDTNYRSAKSIVSKSKNLIEYNKERFPKELNAFSTEDGEVVVKSFTNKATQNKYLISDIINSHVAGIPYEDMAVIFRTNSEANTIANALIAKKIPFYTQDYITDMYKHWVFSDLLIFHKLANQKASLNEFKRVINRPNKFIPVSLPIKEPTLESTLAAAQLIPEHWKREKVSEHLQNFFYELNAHKNDAPYDFICFVRYTLGYDDYIRYYSEKRNLDPYNFLSMLDAILDESKSIPDFKTWLNFAKESSLSIKKELSRKLKTGAVALTTMHKSKGLEWQKVYIINANEDTIPYYKSEKISEIEEERRMFYVAATRAKKSLNVFYSKSADRKRLKASRFLDELTKEKKKPLTPEEYKRRKALAKAKPHASGLTFAEAEKLKGDQRSTMIKANSFVKHPAFGNGMILKINKDIVTIAFQKGGTKQFSLDWCIRNLEFVSKIL